MKTHLSLHGMVHTDRRGFGHERMIHGSVFDLSGADIVARDDDHVIHSSRDPHITILVSPPAITSKIVPGTITGLPLKIIYGSLIREGSERRIGDTLTPASKSRYP